MLTEDNEETGVAPVQLPRELFYFYFAAPFLYAPVLKRTFFDLSLEQKAIAIAENFLPFLCIPAVLHAVYHWVVPRWLGPVRSLALRMVIHAAIVAGVAVAIALLIQPLMGLGQVRGPPVLGFAASCLVLTWTLALPTLMVQELRNRGQVMRQRLADQRQATRRTQLEALQSRTHPHFLFNALNTVAALIPEQPDLAERTLERLADILRYTLRSGREELVPLRGEIAMVEDYLEVQRARFGDRLRYSIELEPGLDELRLPPLLLQPLIENAVLHGIAPRARGGALRLTVARTAGQLAVRVEDQGEGTRAAKVPVGSGTSLRDLRQRLALLYGGACSLDSQPNALGGTTVDVSIPIRAT